MVRVEVGVGHLSEAEAAGGGGGESADLLGVRVGVLLLGALVLLVGVKGLFDDPPPPLPLHPRDENGGAKRGGV